MACWECQHFVLHVFCKIWLTSALINSDQCLYALCSCSCQRLERARWVGECLQASRAVHSAPWRVRPQAADIWVRQWWCGRILLGQGWSRPIAWGWIWEAASGHAGDSCPGISCEAGEWCFTCTCCVQPCCVINACDQFFQKLPTVQVIKCRLLLIDSQHLGSVKVKDEKYCSTISISKWKFWDGRPDEGIRCAPALFDLQQLFKFWTCSEPVACNRQLSAVSQESARLSSSQICFTLPLKSVGSEAEWQLLETKHLYYE